MKISKYNYFVHWNKFYFGVNTITGGKIFLPEKDYKLYEAFKKENKEIKNQEIISLLNKNGFLVPDDVDEFAMIRTKHLHSIHTNQSTYQLTLMPTLDCNLRC